MLFDPNNRATGAAGAAATITKAAASGVSHGIRGVAWSYSAAPTGGGVTITNAGGVTTYLDIDITAAGNGEIRFGGVMYPPAGEALVVTLKAPGGAVVGKVHLLDYRT